LLSLTSSFIALKNRLEGETWAHLLDLEINVNTTARFTSHTETLVSSGNYYATLPFVVGAQDDRGGGELPQLQIIVSNRTGAAFQFAKDNDLSLNNVELRMINVDYPDYGAQSVSMVIVGAVFANEVAQFILGYNFTYDAEGPRRTYNRKDFPSIPFGYRQWAII